MHTLLGTGTALAPLIVSLLAEGGAWWLLPASIAAAVVVLAGVALTQPLSCFRALAARRRPSRRPRLPGRCRCNSGSGSPSRFFMASAKPCSAIGERSTCTSSAPFPMRLAVFWAAVTLGRLLVAVIAARVPPLVIFRALPVLIAVALVCVAFSSSAAFGVAAFALAGLACSACLPLSIGTASSETPRFVETVSGWMVASYMMGYGIGAFAVGPLRQLADLALSDVHLGATAIAVVRRQKTRIFTPRSLAGAALWRCCVGCG